MDIKLYNNIEGMEVLINDETGECFASVKGLARMCMVTPRTIRLFMGYQNDEKQAETLSTSGMEGGYQVTNTPKGPRITRVIPEHDMLKAIIKYNPDLAFACMQAGLRAYLHGAVGFTRFDNARMSEYERIKLLCTKAEPTDWTKKFDDVFYQEMSRLTGLQQQGHKRPQLWGKLTKELVYDALPKSIADGVREARKKDGNLHKLHQYLTADGLELFNKWMNKLAVLMEAHDSIHSLRTSVANVVHRQHQLTLKV